MLCKYDPLEVQADSMVNCFLRLGISVPAVFRMHVQINPEFHLLIQDYRAGCSAAGVSCF